MKTSQRVSLAAGKFLPICLLLFVANACWAQTLSSSRVDNTTTLQLVPPEKLPRYGTFWSLSRVGMAPLPFFAPYLRDAEAPVYLLDRERSVFVVDDSAFDYEALYKQREEQRQLRQAALELGLLSSEDFWAEEGGVPGPMAYSYAPEDFWLEITGVTNDYTYLTLHGTVFSDNDWYQLLSKTNLAQSGEWTLAFPLSEPRHGDPGTNLTLFPPVAMDGNTNMFFRAHHATGYVYVDGGSVAYESNAVFSGQSTAFAVHSTLPTDVTVFYQISGTATNGTDYTGPTGSVLVPANQAAFVPVIPISDNLIEGTETVVLTLTQTNDYLIAPFVQAATGYIKDSSTLVWVTVDANAGEAIEADGPPGASNQIASILFQRDDENAEFPPLAVPYLVSGTASNGVDYITLSGVLTFDEWESEQYLYIAPLADNFVEGVESVKVTLVPTNTYLLVTNSTAATVNIVDTTTTVGVDQIQIQSAIEPNPNSNTSNQTGFFTINRNDTRGEFPALTVSYQLSGTAIQGDDYTNLTGTVTIPSNAPSALVFIEPRFDGQFEGDETVTLTLTRIGDGYDISPDFASATLFIVDSLFTNPFQKVADLNGIVGIDYHSPSNRIIASVAYSASGQPTNFVSIYTNVVSSNLVTVITNWSRVHGAPDEVKLVTVKRTTAGFTNGEVFFGSDRAIGRISADGSVSNMTWCVLTNAVQTNALHLRGSLCWDETGAFGNNVIAVTSYGGADASTKKGVWRVDANRVPTLLANLDTLHLEGAIVLTNDASKWGPWAGKIITGDEETSPPLIYTIDTNGLVTTNDTTQWFPGGIHTEDFDLIPTNQDLYISDLSGSKLMKLPQYAFTNFVGQLLITDGGDWGNFHHPARFFAARWDAATTNFVMTRLFTYSNDVEHVTFAPINLPAQNP